MIYQNTRGFDMATTASDRRAIYAARDEVYDPQPIHTEPADLDDTKHSTEAGAGFVVAVALAGLAICAGLFLAGQFGYLS